MEKRLTLKQKLLVAGTLFGMFFGAGNLIFPVHLGQIAGRNLVPAMLGFIVTAVGIPILGVAAIGNTHSDGLQALASKVGRGYGYFFTCLLYLTIGPFFAIPRCATTSFTTGILPMLGSGISEGAALLVFSGIFFALVLFFSLRPAGITVWIGKIINPLFLIFLTILVAAALADPGAVVSAVEPAAAYESGAFFSAFIEGYGTMDAIAGLAFGIVVIDIIRGMGVTEDSAIAKDVLGSGIFTGVLMALIYIATILMGAQSRGLFETSDNGGIALAQISGHYLGRAGSLVLAFTITFACLKTSIGLVTSCSDAFLRMFPKGPGYQVWAIGFTAFSFFISNFGLSNIISYSLPVLMFLYPPAITLIVLALCGKLFDHDRVVYVCVTAFTCLAAVFDLVKTLPAALQSTLHLEGLIAFAEAWLPLYSLNLGWLVPAILGFALGMVIRAVRK
ncbi:MAG: branched-chain amino acid transport system II carrier protein [Oscillospiraceae bacterium]|nr:branched-chain amino acid transport system II carrier protein [Oscillospiraceae bacterium]MBQ7130045.1 branched-chain amino acid transport system II carrier protein [Oscillospiraceae bacterium]